MLPDKKVKCPATGFAKSCRDIVGKFDCPKFVSIKGQNPQGGTVDRYGCVDSFLPLLLIENAQMSRHVAASVDNLRSEMKDAGEAAEQRQRGALAVLTGGGRVQAIGNG